MSEFLLKSLLGTLLLAAATASFLSMMSLMGRDGNNADPVRLRKRHKTAGLTYILVILPLVYMGLRFLSEMGDALALRGVLHAVLAFALLSLLLLKLAVVRLFRRFTKHAPALGMALFALTLVVFLMTAGFHFLRIAAPRDQGGPVGEAVGAAPPPGRPVEGEKLFRESCLSCHPTAGEERGVGPDLRGILGRETLPASGRPVTPATIIMQLRSPMGTMPAFPHLTEGQIADLLAYFINLRP